MSKFDRNGPSKRNVLFASLSGLAVAGLPNSNQAQPQATPNDYAPILRVTLATPLALDKNVHVSGSFNNWGIDDKAWKMTMLPDGSYAARLPAWVRGNYEFKFHLGNWATEAVTARGAKLGNLSANFSPRKPNYDFAIEGWQGVPAWPKANSTVAGTVVILSNDMAMPSLRRTRRIWAYLPPGYGQSDRRYPVIYMHDGQNVFDRATAFAGEWGVDETLERLAQAGDTGAIVIAINNGERDRNDEFHPSNPDTGRPGRADDYLTFIVSKLKPLVDATFATKPDRLNTAIMGASSGGTISLYAAMKYPDVFGKAAMFSTPLWLAPRFDAMVPDSNFYRPDTKLWFICGANESTRADPPGSFAKDQPALVEALTQAGFSLTTQIKATIDPAGEHNEQFWGRTFEDAYRWLFG
ncbi:MAG: phosphonate ABC transporter ATP-binding protein [Hyphomonadaceae bacterium]|nr:phosphonate ABC transporter ATP-binding protein [Hyphomonadaceae bacterium]